MAVHVCVNVDVCVYVCARAMTHSGLRGTLVKSDFDNPSGKEIS